MRDFFQPEPEDPYDFAPVANDLLDFIFINSEEEHTGSEWVIEYFKTERGRGMAATHMHSHEPLLMATIFGTPPLKDLMDGFIRWFIEMEVKPCLT